MKTKIFLPAALILLACGQICAQSPAPSAPDNNAAQVETLVCLRHGEKPPRGLGQLTPKGLNRALALPKVLIAKFGKPAFIFAPNPAKKVYDSGVWYDYVRPLATIEPTAIACGLPVNAEIAQEDVKALQATLARPEYRSALVFVCWEHLNLAVFARNVVKACGGNPAQVPDWPGKDYDSIFVIKIARQGNAATVSFSIDRENLDGVSDANPLQQTTQ